MKWSVQSKTASKNARRAERPKRSYTRMGVYMALLAVVLSMAFTQLFPALWEYLKTTAVMKRVAQNTFGKAVLGGAERLAVYLSVLMAKAVACVRAVLCHAVERMPGKDAVAEKYAQLKARFPCTYCSKVSSSISSAVDSGKKTLKKAAKLAGQLRR
ncbi:hypothetical protein NECID01_0273 [Nematocida sp. AWRm77]|nr:hypothetical protein NECID01_0273 [Nematocida sp. AWRm77]